MPQNTMLQSTTTTEAEDRAVQTYPGKSEEKNYFASMDCAIDWLNAEKNLVRTLHV
jgi:hypothetical protein